MYALFSALALIINEKSSIVYESYARSPHDLLNSTPKEPGDFRERIERETIKG
jgi:hypothetical protein